MSVIEQCAKPCSVSFQDGWGTASDKKDAGTKQKSKIVET
jgi:hypothetical protein